VPRRKEREARMEVERASSPEFEEERTKMETVKTVSWVAIGTVPGTIRGAKRILAKKILPISLSFLCGSGSLY
jgi:hypothetical protein